MKTVLGMLVRFVLQAYRFIHTFRDQFLRKIAFLDTDGIKLPANSDIMWRALGDAFVAAPPSLTESHRAVLQVACKMAVPFTTKFSSQILWAGRGYSITQSRGYTSE
jgi:hypothetical protein